jgi:hypothetical protein
MGHWRTINGEHVYIKSRGENRSSQVFKNPKIPKNAKLITHELRVKTTPYVRVTVDNSKVHNPTEVELKDLASPVSGAPLEPASEYGSTTVWDPYTGRFVAVTTPESVENAKQGKGAETVKPRFTKQEEDALKIQKSYVKQASETVTKDPSYSGLKKATRILEDATRVQYTGGSHEVSPNATKKQIDEAYIMTSNWERSAMESSGAEKEHYVKRGVDRIKQLEKGIED